MILAGAFLMIAKEFRNGNGWYYDCNQNCMVQPNGLKYVMELEVPVCVCEGGQLFALQLAKLAFFYCG